MKQIFYFTAFMTVVFFIGNEASAQYDHRWNDAYQNGNNNCRDNRQQSFYYYPQSNVYFSFKHAAIHLSLPRFVDGFGKASASLAFTR